MAFVSHCCSCATNHSDKMLIFKNGTWMIQSPYELEDSFTAYMFVTSAAIRPYELDTKSWQVSIRGKRREQIITVSTSRVQYDKFLAAVARATAAAAPAVSITCAITYCGEVGNLRHLFGTWIRQPVWRHFHRPVYTACPRRLEPHLFLSPASDMTSACVPAWPQSPSGRHLLVFDAATNYGRGANPQHTRGKWIVSPSSYTYTYIPTSKHH
jgi:hypothetical protein